MRVASRTIATPASLRRIMRVVPAWFCSPISETRKLRMPTIASTIADAQPGGVERVALLDMGFEIADMAAGFELFARPAGEPGARKRLAQRRAVVAAA